METNELIIDNLDFLKEYLPKLICAIEDGGDYLVLNNEVEAFKYFTEIVEGIEWTIRSINSLQKFKYIKFFNSDEVNSVLFEITNAFEKKDLILLNDLFQYELLERLVEWYSNVNQVNTQIIKN